MIRDLMYVELKTGYSDDTSMDWICENFKNQENDLL